MTNPLLSFTDLIDYAAVRPEHVMPAVTARIERARSVLAEVTQPQTPATWEAVVAPLERATLLLRRTWGAVTHLSGVCDSPELRKVFNEALVLVTAFDIEVAQSALPAKYRAVRQDASFGRLDATRRKILEDALLDFRLSGAFLEGADKERFKQIRTELSVLEQKFSENVLDATHAYALDVEDASRLAGVPQAYLDSFASEARAAGKKGWLVTLQAPSYLAVMRYAEDRALRQELFRARATLASEAGDAPQFDNAPVIERILALRAELARLLGFANYASYSLADKMAESPEEVTRFLRELARRAKPFARKELEEVFAFAREELGIEDPANWDVTFAAEKLRQKRYAFSDDEVKRYFTLEAVFEGLFSLVEFFFGVRIAPAEASLWNEDVRFFEIRDEKGARIAQFYVDLYARKGKRSGAWMDNERTRNRAFGRLETPVAYLVTNFLKPEPGRPSLLTHDEVETLFHEFGHGLEHLLTAVDEASASGINGVEWDAVECASQFMENFTYDARVLKRLTRHEETMEPIPEDLIEKIRNARNFGSGMATVRQVEFALFDMLLHEKTEDFDVRGTLEAVRREVAVLARPDYDRFANAFSHIFAGGYAAGYYSYKYSEVMSADAFSLFEQKGVLDRETGRRWLKEVLSVGSSRPFMDSFVAFRGRKPRIDALLEHAGLEGEPCA